MALCIRSGVVGLLLPETGTSSCCTCETLRAGVQVITCTIRSLEGPACDNDGGATAHLLTVSGTPSQVPSADAQASAAQLLRDWMV